MWRLLILSSVLVIGTTSSPGLPCDHPPDESFDEGCRAYTRCVDGVYTLIECEYGLVFNKDTGVCDDPHNVPKPCGVWEDCSNLPNGKYPDLEFNCTFYYTCHDNLFFGHNPCPDGLVFNPTWQGCDWIYNVAPPCGTLQ